MKRFAAFAIILALIIALPPACSAKQQQGEVVLEPTPLISPTPAPTAGPTDAISYERLPLIREEAYIDGNVMIYPIVDGAGHARLNGAIYAAVLAGFEEAGEEAYTFFSVKCNQDGLLSLYVSYYGMESGALLLRKALNFDINAAREIAIEELFNKTNDRWRSIMPDLITEQAESRGIVLLSDILPIADGQMFYISQSTLTIVYRPYEISTFSAGWPEFGVPLEDFKLFFEPNGFARRLLESADINTEQGE